MVWLFGIEYLDSREIKALNGEKKAIIRRYKRILKLVRRKIKNKCYDGYRLIPDEPDGERGRLLGMKYIIRRDYDSGCFSGYVQLSKNSSLFKKLYKQLYTDLRPLPNIAGPLGIKIRRKIHIETDVIQKTTKNFGIMPHFGCKYFSRLSGARGWWLGFRCSHANEIFIGNSLMPSYRVGDYPPRRVGHTKNHPELTLDNGLYRDINYVRKELRKLAMQVNRAEKRGYQLRNSFFKEDENECRYKWIMNKSSMIRSENGEFETAQWLSKTEFELRARIECVIRNKKLISNASYEDAIQLADELINKYGGSGKFDVDAYEYWKIKLIDIIYTISPAKFLSCYHTYRICIEDSKCFLSGIQKNSRGREI